MFTSKPPACQNCALHHLGTGFAPPSGPPTSPLAFMGEALGREEAYKSEPFIGAAGSLLNRALRMAGIERTTSYILNSVQCFPGDTLVESRGVEKAFKRYYSGEVVTILTRTGKLTGTPKHPALTGQGWMSLGKIQKGDYLVRGSFGENVPPPLPSNPHVEDVPSSFKELFRALRNLGVRERVVGREMDFHGDGGEAEVEVVCTDRLLRNRYFAPSLEHRLQLLLEEAAEAKRLLHRHDTPQDPSANGHRVPLGASYSSVGGSGQSQPAGSGHSAKSVSLSLTRSSHSNSSRNELPLQPSLADVAALRQGLQSGPTLVELDEVVEVQRSWFASHVYNLQTESGEYLANGFVVHNCQPPMNELDGAPYGDQALQHCKRAHVEPALERWLAAQTGQELRTTQRIAGGYSTGQEDEGTPIGGTPYTHVLQRAAEPVLVTLGGTPLRSTLNLQRGSAHTGGGGGRVQDFHGTVHRSPCDRFWIVPSYHPSHIQRGAFNLLSVLRFDLQVAQEVSQGQYYPEPISTILDPPVEWFSQWADNYLEAALRDPSIWLAVDIETPDKAKKLDEGELTSKDRDFHILRVNLSCHRDEGLTIPFSGPYITILQRILNSRAPKIFWNWRYDVPRLVYAKIRIQGAIYDAMEMWHKLQSDLPRGLGFVAPFYSHYGAWKHLAGSEPVQYAALDGPQTLRCAHGIARDLQDEGMWQVAFFRHVYMLDQLVLQDMEAVGLYVDEADLHELDAELEADQAKEDATLNSIFPRELCPRTPKQGLSKHPKLEDGSLEPDIEEKRERRMIRGCNTCGEEEIPAKHRCKNPETGKPLKVIVAPTVVMEEREVSRFYRIEPFSPGSPQQILQYIYARGHKPGKHKKTKKPTTDKQTIEKLARSTKDPFYRTLLRRRGIAKVKSTYVVGSLNRLKSDPRSIEDGRLHAHTTHKPSTQRLSMMNPNLTNVIARGEHGSHAVRFRKCVKVKDKVKDKLVEVDFSGIEALLSGYFMGDPDYIWWARKGIHALVAANLLAQKKIIPWSDVPNRTWAEEDISAALKHIKKHHDGPYNQCKRCVHGKNYGLTTRGMHLQFPDEFPTIRAAQEIEDIYYKVAPKLQGWQTQVRELAARQGYLGGPGAHPFGYKHWFFNVLSYRAVPAGAHNSDLPIVKMGNRNFFVAYGDDSKRCVAFYPQSTAAGIIKEAMLRLFAYPDSPSYIGDAFYGRTPLRAPIHDSLLLEVPISKMDHVIEKLVLEMTRPIPELPCPVEWNLGSHLSIGVEVKVGTNWAAYAEDTELHREKGIVNLLGMRGVDAPTGVAQPVPPSSLASDVIVPFDEHDEDADEDELETLRVVRESA